MIPAGLAASHAAFHAWRNSIEPTGPTPLAQLDDEDLGDVYRVLSNLTRDVTQAHDVVRDLFVRRLMATKGAGSDA